MHGFSKTQSVIRLSISFPLHFLIMTGFRMNNRDFCYTRTRSPVKWPVLILKKCPLTLVTGKWPLIWWPLNRLPVVFEKSALLVLIFMTQWKTGKIIVI